VNAVDPSGLKIHESPEINQLYYFWAGETLGYLPIDFGGWYLGNRAGIFRMNDNFMVILHIRSDDSALRFGKQEWGR
jgi:hypothetical protein